MELSDRLEQTTHEPEVGNNTSVAGPEKREFSGRACMIFALDLCVKGDLLWRRQVQETGCTLTLLSHEDERISEEAVKEVLDRSSSHPVFMLVVFPDASQRNPIEVLREIAEISSDGSSPKMLHPSKILELNIDVHDALKGKRYLVTS
ncbi:hypothetical protein COV82_02985 [Candidatus Peregrinibacteria bacterium CG11_big_fil_rev_8_21_14_0_20_46_8]|nr:MAG: hypothetical protein COV82_02985 [Candidatus Peregrinibacteria bacterium CG11_big_fil_rev_8_21_14_0_20_46_8]